MVMLVTGRVLTTMVISDSDALLVRAAMAEAVLAGVFLH